MYFVSFYTMDLSRFFKHERSLVRVSCRPATFLERLADIHIPVWAANAKLSVAFQVIEPISSEVGDGGVEGGVAGGCKDVGAFMANAQQLLQQNCVGCHGGGNAGAKGAVDMSSLGADPAAACAQVKNRVNPDDAAQSQIFITTDPGGNAAHPYKFGGNGGNFSAFRTQVSQWITAEKQ